MAVTSNRLIQLTMTGDVEYSQEFSAAVNAAGSGQNQLIDLTDGDNTITVPTGAVAVTIIPPADNEAVITLKGDVGDTGIILSPVDPCSLSLDGVTEIILNVNDDLAGVRFIFS